MRIVMKVWVPEVWARVFITGGKHKGRWGQLDNEDWDEDGREWALVFLDGLDGRYRLLPKHVLPVEYRVLLGGKQER